MLVFRKTKWNNFFDFRSICSKFPRYEKKATEENQIGDAIRKECVEVLDSQEHKIAFKMKSNWEILRALVVLRLCGFDTLVDRAEQIFHSSKYVIGNKLSQYLIEKTIYDQFVGGKDIKSLQQCGQRLKNAGIGILLAVPIEDQGETSTSLFDNNYKTLIESVNLAAEIGGKYPMIQLKVTALISGNLLTKVSKMLTKHKQTSITVESTAEAMQTGYPVNFSELSKEENLELHESIIRHKNVCQYAGERGVKIMVDAEYTYMNPAISLHALAMMLNFNKSVPNVWKTYQCYLKQTLDEMVHDHDLMRQHGVCFGAKIVRGAYLVKERSLAAIQGYADPVHGTYEETNTSYDKAVSKLLDACSELGHKVNFIIASHNENSIKAAMKRMDDLNIPKDIGQVFFGQLLGMCDQISYPLGQSGHLVYKSVPYGTIQETIPYLIRRAQENRSVMMGTRQERYVLWNVMKSRLWNRT